MSTVDDYIKRGSGYSPFASIRARLLLVVLAVFAPLLIFVLVVTHKQAQFERNELERDMSIWVSTALTAREQALHHTTETDFSWWEDFVARAELPHESILYLLDQQGQVLDQFPHRDAENDNHFAEEETETATPGESFSHVDLVSQQMADKGLLNTKDASGQEQLLIFNRLKNEMGEARGYLVVEAELSELFAEINAFRRQNLTWLGILLLALVGLVWQISETTLARPLKKLTKAAEALGTGDMTVRIGAPYQAGELGQLARTFDHMANRVASHAADLERGIKERTTELEEKVQELEKVNQFIASRGIKLNESRQNAE